MDSNHRCLDVGQESSPLDHGISFSSRGGNRTHKLSPSSRPGRFACLRTRPSNCGGRIRTGALRRMRPCWKPDSSPLRSVQGSRQCVGQELNLHSVTRVGYSHLGSPMPSRRISSSTGGNRTHSRSPRFELGRFAGLRTVPASVPGGIRTRDLHRDRVASTPGCSTRTEAPGAGVEPTSSSSELDVLPVRRPRNQ